MLEIFKKGEAGYKDVFTDQAPCDSHSSCCLNSPSAMRTIRRVLSEGVALGNAQSQRLVDKLGNACLTLQHCLPQSRHSQSRDHSPAKVQRDQGPTKCYHQHPRPHGSWQAHEIEKLTSRKHDSGHLTPPPDDCTLAYAPQPSPTTSFNQLLPEDIARLLNPYLAVTSPDIDHHASTASGHRFTGSEHGSDTYNTDPFVAAHMDHMDAAIDVTDFAEYDSKYIFSDGAIVVGSDFEPDFHSMVNLDGAEEIFGGALDGECA